VQVVIEQGTGPGPQRRPGTKRPATTGIGSTPQQRGYPDAAKGTALQVSEHGRIPANITEQYEAAAAER
jgi:hypothetical protein